MTHRTSDQTHAWWAPGRVNLIGDHTDYSGGFVLPFAIQLGTTTVVTPRNDGVLSTTSAQIAEPTPLRALAELSPNADSWTAYVEGTAWVLATEGVPLTGAHVHVDSNLPVSAGLSSSAALICSAMGALLAAARVSWDPHRMAVAAQRVENEYVGAPIGAMDPMVVMRATEDHALFIDTRSGSCEAVPLGLDGAGLALLIVDTGTTHRTTGVEYGRRVAQCHQAARLLGVPSLRDVAAAPDVDILSDHTLRARARHVVTENLRVLQTVALLRANQLRAIGPLMLASHASLRDDFQVSTPELDLVVESATHAGALGARLTGAGLGGCAVLLVEAAETERVAHEVRAACAARGFTRPRVLPVRPSWGAHPIRPVRFPRSAEAPPGTH